jgi:hypothetical protein
MNCLIKDSVLYFFMKPEHLFETVADKVYPQYSNPLFLCVMAVDLERGLVLKDRGGKYSIGAPVGSDEFIEYAKEYAMEFGKREVEVK